MNMRKSFLVFAVLTAFVTVSWAQDGADPRIKKSLDSLGIKYSVNSSNNYKVVYTMDKDADRSQLVFIVSKTETYRSVELREIWSVAAVLDEYPGEETIHYILNMNSTSKIGAWAIEESDDGELWLLYTTKVPVALSPDELKDIVYFVAEVCDEMEAELVGDDED